MVVELKFVSVWHTALWLCFSAVLIPWFPCERSAVAVWGGSSSKQSRSRYLVNAEPGRCEAVPWVSLFTTRRVCFVSSRWGGEIGNSIQRLDFKKQHLLKSKHGCLGTGRVNIWSDVDNSSVIWMQCVFRGPAAPRRWFPAIFLIPQSERLGPWSRSLSVGSCWWLVFPHTGVQWATRSLSVGAFGLWQIESNWELVGF